MDDEIWVHADDDGAFYVIDVDALEVSEIVEAGLEGEGHGKLLYHEAMGDTGYATNVNDPGVPVIDLETYERTGFVEFGEGGSTTTRPTAHETVSRTSSTAAGRLSSTPRPTKSSTNSSSPAACSSHPRRIDSRSSTMRSTLSM